MNKFADEIHVFICTHLLCIKTCKSFVLFRRLRNADSSTRRLSPESIFLGKWRAETKQVVDDTSSDPNDIDRQRQGDQDTAFPTQHPTNLLPMAPTSLGYGSVEGLDRPTLPPPYLPCGCRRYQDDADVAMTRCREILFGAFESRGEDGINHLLRNNWRSNQNSSRVVCDRSTDSGRELRRQNSMPPPSIIRRMACGRGMIHSAEDCPPSSLRRPAAPSLDVVCLLRRSRADDESLVLRRLRLKEGKKKKKRTETVTECRPLISTDCCHLPPCVAHRCHFERSPAALQCIGSNQVSISSLPAV